MTDDKPADIITRLLKLLQLRVACMSNEWAIETCVRMYDPKQHPNNAGMERAANG